MSTNAVPAQSPFDPETTRIERVLCFTAHPDDIDFGAAGTVAAWTAAGVQVSYCIMTDGDAGGFDPEQREEIVRLRVRGAAARRRPGRRHGHPLPAPA